jgi:hypothetical protein
LDLRKKTEEKGVGFKNRRKMRWKKKLIDGKLLANFQIQGKKDLEKSANTARSEPRRGRSSGFRAEAP